MFDKEQGRACLVWLLAPIFFFHFMSLLGLKISPSHPHLHMPPLLQPSILAIITSYLLYVIAGSSCHSWALVLLAGRRVGGGEIKVRV